MGHQGRPMGLRGDLQEHFCHDYELIRGQLTVCLQRANQTKITRKGLKQSRLAQNQALWQGWAKPSATSAI